jgi:glycerophosphoryl diester phosphodiesterase
VVSVSYGAESTPLAIAHRGGMALAPENTLAAFGRATALGLRYLETDVHTTRDGHLVCFHDPTLRRVNELPGRIRDIDLHAVRRLRVGGEPVPTLAEAMSAFPDANFAVDLKDEWAVDAMARLLRKHPEWTPRLCVAAAWSRWLMRLQDEVPGVVTALGWRSLTTLVAWSRGGVRPPAGVARGAFAHLPLRLGRVPVMAPTSCARCSSPGVSGCPPLAR